MAHEFAARGFVRRDYSRSRPIGYLLNGQLQDKLLSARKISQIYPGTPMFAPPGGDLLLLRRITPLSWGNAVYFSPGAYITVPVPRHLGHALGMQIPAIHLLLRIDVTKHAYG